MSRMRRGCGGWSTAWMIMALVGGGLLGAERITAQGPGLAAQRPGAATAVEHSVVYLVRHAEKATENPADPALTAEGVARATELARALADAGIDRVFSTETVRTRSTAAPVAEAAGVEIESYDAGSTDGIRRLVEVIRSEPGRYLVVGHSNTTPPFVRELGGDPVGAISEDEYDRLYIVVLGADGAATSTLLRFGAPSGGGE